MDKLDMQSKNLVDENISKIAELFPNCITEGKNEEGQVVKLVDFDLLKQELSKDIVEGNDERYTLNWAGKKQAILTANSPINATLRPCREESVDFDNTKNLYIEGDNLDVLKLLRETYLGKVKMIYIDPPYNTGNDFVYEDDFATSAEDYLQASKSYDEQGNRLTDSIILTDLVGEKYTTEEKEFEGYIFSKVEGTTEGEYIDGEIEVTYIYEKEGTGSVEPPQTNVDNKDIYISLISLTTLVGLLLSRKKILN